MIKMNIFTVFGGYLKEISGKNVRSNNEKVTFPCNKNTTNKWNRNINTDNIFNFKWLFVLNSKGKTSHF